MVRLLLIVVLAGGCIEREGDLHAGEATCGDGVMEGPSEWCDDGNTTNGDRCDERCRIENLLGVTWEITSLGSTEATHCVPDFQAAVVRVRPYQTAGCLAPCDETPLDDVQTFKLDCALGQTQQYFYVRPGISMYVTVALENATGEQYAQSVTHRANLLESRVSEHTIYRDAGYIQLRWELVAATGARVQCRDLGVDVIGIRATSSTGTATTFEVPCDQYPLYQATSPPLTPNDYTVEVTAGSVTTQISDVTVRPANQVTDLGIIQLQF